MAFAALSAVMLMASLVMAACSSGGTKALAAGSGIVDVAEHQGTDAVDHLGDAVVSYLAGKEDLSAVQALVAPSALAGLNEMLSSIGRPSRSSELAILASESRTTAYADLQFFHGTDDPIDYTVAVEVDALTKAVTIVGIKPGSPLAY
jgi:hypothetical protein